MTKPESTMVTATRPSTLPNGSPPQRRAEMALAADAPLGWREPADAEGELLERLHIAVAELFKAVSNALLDERESAEECIRRASAILRVDLPAAISQPGGIGSEPGS